MLNNEAKKSSHQTDSDSRPQNAPDPWLTSSPVQKISPVTQTWHLSTETSPLISPAGNPDAPSLVSHQCTSEEILLSDELKLRASVGSLLKQQLEKALALLYWWKNRATKPNEQKSSNSTQ